MTIVPGLLAPAGEVPPRNGTRGNDRDEESVMPRASPAAASAVERCQGQTSWHGSRVPTRPGPEEGGRGGDVAGALRRAQTRGPVTARHHEAQLGSPVCRARLPPPQERSAAQAPAGPPAPRHPQAPLDHHTVPSCAGVCAVLGSAGRPSVASFPPRKTALAGAIWPAGQKSGKAARGPQAVIP